MVSRIPGFILYADRNMVVRWANQLATSLLGRRVLGRQLSRVLPATLLSSLGEALERKAAVTAMAVGIGAEAGGREGPRLLWDVSDLDQILADGPRVEQFLSNLVDNAVKFSREDGEIRIRAMPWDDQVRCEVKDDGPGICDTDISRIFEPLLQLEPSMTRCNRGTGLGLFLSKALTDAQGGTIGVTKGDDGGTVFWFTMPVWDSVSSNGSVSVIVVDSPSL